MTRSADRPITILHLADIHFGMENFGTINPRTGLHTRLEDFRDSLNQAIDLAIESTVDLVVFAGDAYKRNAPSPTEQREFVTCFCRLADAGIPTVMISGNHDIPVMHGKASSIDIFRRLRPGMFHVFINRPTFGEENPPLVLETRNGPVAICAFPFLSPSYLFSMDEFKGLNHDDLHEQYEQFFHDVLTGMTTGLPDDIPRILVAHLTVHGATLGGYRGVTIKSDEVQVLPSTLATAGYDYVALGHIHKYQNLSTREEIPVVYPGSIDRVDFGERHEDKGVILAKVSRGASTFEFRPLDVRTCIQIHVEAAEGDDLTRALCDEIAGHSIEGAIVRVSFLATDAEVALVDMKAVHTMLKPAHYVAGLVRIPRVSDSTRRHTTVSGDIRMRDALLEYIREHDQLKPEAEALLAKAIEIEEHIRQR